MHRGMKGQRQLLGATVERFFGCTVLLRSERCAGVGIGGEVRGG